VKARKSLNFAAKMNGSPLPRDLDITEDTSTSTVSLNLFSLGKKAPRKYDFIIVSSDHHQFSTVLV
jgi:hypothetical protein